MMEALERYAALFPDAMEARTSEAAAIYADRAAVYIRAGGVQRVGRTIAVLRRFWRMRQRAFGKDRVPDVPIDSVLERLTGIYKAAATRALEKRA